MMAIRDIPGHLRYLGEIRIMVSEEHNQLLIAAADLLTELEKAVGELSVQAMNLQAENDALRERLRRIVQLADGQ